MVLVEVVYKCKPGTREAFHRETLASGFLDTVKREIGCLRYDFTFPVDRPDEILLLERWEDALNWEDHKKAPHVRDFQAIKAKYVLDTIAEMLRVV